MPPKTRSRTKGATHAFEELPPQTRKRSTSSVSSTSGNEDAMVLTATTPTGRGRGRDIRRHYTIELPAQQLRAMEAAKTATSGEDNTTPKKTLKSSPTTHVSGETATATSTPASSSPKTPRWGFTSLFTTVRKILSPTPPSRKVQPTAPPPPPPTSALTTISEETPRRPEATPAAQPLQSTQRKRKAPEDTPATQKRAKMTTPTPRRRTSLSPTKTPATQQHQTSTRRSAKTVREQRYNTIIESQKTPDIPYIPKPEEPTEDTKKRKRVKIDELQTIPSRRAGQSTGTFALLDEFFDEDEDSVEIDEEEFDMHSGRPSKIARTAQNVFDMASPKSSEKPKSPKKILSPKKKAATPIPAFNIQSPSTPQMVPAGSGLKHNSSANSFSPMDTTSPLSGLSSSAPKPLTPMDFKATTPASNLTPMDIKTTTPASNFTPMDTSKTLKTGPPFALGTTPSPMDTSKTSRHINTPMSISRPESDPEQGPSDSPTPDQQPDALIRKRSEAEKYKPTVGSRLKEMQRSSSASGATKLGSSSPLFPSPATVSQIPGFPSIAPVQTGTGRTSTTPQDTPPTHALLSAPGTKSHTPTDTPPDRAIFSAPKTKSYTPAETPPEHAIFTAPKTASYTPTDTPPEHAILGAPPTTSFTPNDTPPSQPKYSPPPLSPHVTTSTDLHADTAASPVDSLFDFPTKSPLTSLLTDEEITRVISLPPTTHKAHDIDNEFNTNFATFIGKRTHHLPLAELIQV